MGGEIMLTRSAVEKIRKEYDKICVCKEITRDISPFEAYVRMREPYSFLLESTDFHKKATFSFLGTAADHVALTGIPLDVLRPHRDKKIYVERDLSRFIGGMVGFVSYDMVRQFERLPDIPSGRTVPDAQFLIANDCLVFDHETRKIYGIVLMDSCEEYRHMKERMSLLEKKLTRSPRVKSHGHSGKFCSPVSQDAFMERVRRAKEHISAGDIFQVVLSRKITAEIRCDPLLLYRALRKINPSPYMYFLDFDDLVIIGSSPEMLVRLDGKKAWVRPIAGTRSRGKTEGGDRKLEKEMLADEKERAEHVMLLDLGRNDLGRVCEYGSVQVEEVMVVEKYSHVQHIVSSVSGTLRKGKDAFDLFKAVFPAGTVSGAPKVRAMKIIDELEPQRRGVYAGGVGYFSYNGNMDFAIAIRTMVLSNTTLTAQGGAGIVADSDPAAEYHETEKKLQAIRSAVREAVG
jgi:anthranilate synthase component 1